MPTVETYIISEVESAILKIDKGLSEVKQSLETLKTARLGWQPIETAPKDGTVIFAACCNAYRTVYWRNESWYDVEREHKLGFTPTHWRSLLKLPEEQV